MAVDLKKDWPIAAAVALGVLALILMSRRTAGVQPVVFGGGSAAGAEAAITAQAQISQAQIAAQASGFQTLVQEFGATERVKVEQSAVLESIRIRTGLERQKAEYSFITGLPGIIGGILGLFSWETTATGERYRRSANRRMVAAYGAGV